MKKYLFSSLLTLAISNIYAGVGDTTVISTHDKTKLNWYQAYDTVATFPSDTHSFNRIMMEFELGKYACDGYNPNNPGENPGQTGWCADWDYDVHILACAPNGDTVELGRLITPYANSNFPRTGSNWSHSYWFDVTDYYSLLKDDVTIRIFYAGWSGGFTGTVKFHMIEGPRNRDVISLVPLWNEGFLYGDPDTSINDRIPALSVVYPNNASAAEYKMFITGHGGDNTQNCAEFCSKWYELNVNNIAYDRTNIWRDDCGDNFLYPQSGTWVYDRGNWCPGDLVHVNRHILTNRVNPGDTFDIDLNFQNYNSAHKQASYKVSGAAFFYSDYTVNNDVSIEAIMAPNNDETFYRLNPICSNPIIKVKNRGKNDITTLNIQYGIGSTSQTYSFNGLIKSEEEQEITLPTLNIIPGNEFIVAIDQVNGVADDVAYNNTLKSSFTPAPILEHGTFLFDVQNLNNYTNTLSYKIIDANQNEIFSKSISGRGEKSLEYVGLENGCYELEVTTSLGYGLRFFTAFPAGYFNMYDIYNHDTVKIALPKNDLGSSSLAGNFGNGFKHQFTVTNSQALNTKNIQNHNSVNLYPNPTNSLVTLEVNGQLSSGSHYTIYDALGRMVISGPVTDNKTIINTTTWSNGMYTVRYFINNEAGTVKLNVIK